MSLDEFATGTGFETSARYGEAVLVRVGDRVRQPFGLSAFEGATPESRVGAWPCGVIPHGHVQFALKYSAVTSIIDMSD